MSILKDISIDIQDMLTQGFSPNTIARILEIPVSWVYETMSNPSEAEDVEWDFDNMQAVD
jgi:DNA invertase Pin-like site-specific DNA recombinase